MVRSLSWSLAPTLAGLAVLLASSLAQAEQLVLLDVTFTFTKADADNATPSKSHYYVKSDRLNAATPLDWTKPIDYRNGVLHVRTEVMDKPAGSADTRWTLCYIARKGIDAGYGCSNTALYKEEGVWEFEQGMTEWWQNDNIDWTQGIKQMDLVMKDGKGVFAHTQPDPERWFPTTLRITMIQVSQGATYDPSLVPGLPAGSGGAGGAAGAAGMSSAGAAGGVALGGNGNEPALGGASAGGAAGSASVGGNAPSSPAAGMSGSGGSGATGGASPVTSPLDSASEDAGCALGGAPRGSWLALAALGGALAAGWRRRRSA